MSDYRQFAPATLRNREPILEVLLQVLPPTGTVLEIASGTGEHAVFLAPRLQPRLWLPSDPNPLALASITAWQQQDPAPNLAAPITIDVTQPHWSSAPTLQNALKSFPQNPPPDQGRPENFGITSIVNINMIHISPWAACLGLMAGAKDLLPMGGVLYLYGPFQQHGQPTSPSNIEFDASLRSQNPAWGVRNLEEVVAVAEAQNLKLQTIFPMPANNLSVIFQKVS
ncbi:MAG: DUF938 domain-containing protein [Coleofasciculaceae cyanobacterium SM2_1_6]|nr:DUF938 domain-containing protein [Coleofasciculaceae cyanobacterium SM2_1_6]